MDNAIDTILQIILNGGVIGSCGALCSQLPDQIEQAACSLICDYVGIEAFIDLINYEDPDPIYICQGKKKGLPFERFFFLLCKTSVLFQTRFI